MNGLLHLDLFSGIGGFSLGLESAGFKTIAFCENDEPCRKILRLRWPGVPIYQDIRELNEPIHADIITGGYPCQPFSQAGKRRGEEDDRHLWPEMLRVIKLVKPRWVIAENVAGHISMGLDSVLSDLEGEGYSTEVFVLPACAVDAKHRRDRVWIMAYARDGADRTDRGAQGEKDRISEKHRSKGQRWVISGASSSKQVMADSFESGLERQPRNVKGRGESGRDNKGQDGSVSEGGVSPGQNRERGWLSESGICRISHGIPNRVDRLKQLGNSIVPQIAHVLGRAIMNHG